MGEVVRLASRASDRFVFDAYRAPVADARRGGLILIQEVFGVTGHIRELADGFAEDGYETLAPSLYDRRHPGFQADYTGPDLAEARRLSEATPWDEVAGDLQACADALAGPLFAVGYCWGGTAAWLAACRVEVLRAASCYYGRRIPELLGETPRCPTILHFGRRDASIPPETVETVRDVHPDLPVYVYDAGHGFNSNRRADYDPDSARLGRLRTLQLFHTSAGAKGEMGG